MILAAIDIGSNAVRLLICEVIKKGKATEFNKLNLLRINLKKTKNEKVYYRKIYDSFFKRGDLFSLFIELATSKLTKNGYVSFIVPSIILNNLSYKLIICSSNCSLLSSLRYFFKSCSLEFFKIISILSDSTTI